MHRGLLPAQAAEHPAEKTESSSKLLISANAI